MGKNIKTTKVGAKDMELDKLTSMWGKLVSFDVNIMCLYCKLLYLKKLL